MSLLSYFLILILIQSATDIVYNFRFIYLLTCVIVERAYGMTVSFMTAKSYLQECSNSFGMSVFPKMTFYTDFLKVETR